MSAKAVIGKAFLILFLWGVAAAPVEAQTANCQLPKDYADRRPGTADQATVVEVAVYVNNIFSIQETAQLFQADFFIRASWKDPRLAWGSNQNSKGLCWYSANEIWIPPIVIVNRAGLTPQYSDWVSVHEDGTVVWLQRYYGTLSNHFTLQRFPFDKQTLKISLISFYDEDQVQFKIFEGPTRADDISLINWKLGAATTRLGKYAPPFREKMQHSYILSVPVKRNSGFYIWRVLLPIGFIVLMGMCVFWISPVHRLAQISLASTSFLTLIAFQIQTSNITPKTGYLTVLSAFTFWATLVLFITLVETIGVSVLAGRGEEKLAKRIDWLARITMPAFFFLGSFWVFLD